MRKVTLWTLRWFSLKISVILIRGKNQRRWNPEPSKAYEKTLRNHWKSSTRENAASNIVFHQSLCVRSSAEASCSAIPFDINELFFYHKGRVRQNKEILKEIIPLPGPLRSHKRNPTSHLGLVPLVRPAHQQVGKRMKASGFLINIPALPWASHSLVLHLPRPWLLQATYHLPCKL